MPDPLSLSRAQPRYRPVVGFIDLRSPPPILQANPAVLQTLFALNSHPALNLDGDPYRFSTVELSAALANPYVTNLAKQQLGWVAQVVPFARNQKASFPAALEPIRQALIARGFPVVSGPYPADLEIPREVAELKLGFPFSPGSAVVCQQGNNSMADQTSHSPAGLRYSLDFTTPEYFSAISTGAVGGAGAAVPILATAAGTVYVYGNARINHPDNWGLGNLILIDHGNGYATLLAHMDEQAVQTGQQVKRGEVLGTMGATGSAGNPHLHLQVVKLRAKPDPANETYHAEFPSPGELPPMNAPPTPFEDAGVPFDLAAQDLADAVPRRIRSTDFQGAQAGYLPELAHAYSAGTPLPWLEQG